MTGQLAGRLDDRFVLALKVERVRTLRVRSFFARCTLWGVALVWIHMTAGTTTQSGGIMSRTRS
jgi:hypothetical protein